MRKISVLFLAAALLMPAACSAPSQVQELQQEVEEWVEEAAEPASSAETVYQEESDAEEQPAPEEEQQAASPDETAEEPEPEAVQGGPEQSLGPDFPAELVYDREGTSGTLPEIDASLSAAAEVNDDIDGRFGYLVGDPSCSLRYEWHTGFDDRVLSVLIEVRYEWDQSLYTVYNFDLSDGSLLSGRQLLSLVGVGEEELRDIELSQMRSEFEAEFGSARGEISEELYAERLELTVSPDNAELDRVWLGDLGQLMFVARIYSLAGADFYEYPMSTGYVFS